MNVPKATRKPNGKWAIQLRLKNSDGDTVSYYILEDTEAKAKAKAAAYKAALKAEMMPEKRKGTDKTLRQAIDEYIAKRSNVLSPSTIRGYRTIEGTRFASVMDKPLSGVKDWQKVVNDEAGVCSAKTLKNAWFLVNSALRENKITVSVDLPPVVKPDKKWLTPEQTLVFVEAVKGKWCEIGALLALHGLRRSEIFGLNWSAVDLAAGTIKVRGAVVLGEDNQTHAKKANKTAASARTVRIMIPALFEAMEAVEDKTGAVVKGNMNALYSAINRVCASSGLPEVGVHGLRHSFASLCYHLGISEMETMKRGGWSNLATVHEIYTHISEADHLEADEKLLAFYKNATEKC